MVFSHTSLLEKLNLTTDQLDYKYIENCKNVKQLENILRVLRSGEEGEYPHLLKFCEARLQQVDPNNKHLLSAKGIMSYSDLSKEDKENVLSGLQEWSKKCSERRSQNSLREVCDIPPVRGQNIFVAPPQIVLDNEKQKEDSIKHKNFKPRSYQEWDKFDVDEELGKLEAEEKPEQTEKIAEEKVRLKNTIPVVGLSAAEREHISSLERIKGNEAFKAQEYEEALLYYTRSLSVFRTANTLNNRAQTHLKLKHHLEAVIDCNEVISLEPNNIKALYRRGIAHKEAQMFDLAAIDFKILLTLHPENKSAKEQLEQIENSLAHETQKSRKVVIEELESETLQNDENDESSVDIEDEDKSRRLAIEEVTESPRQMLDEICNCNIGNDDTIPLSKSTKEMLNIFKHTDASKVYSKSEKVKIEEIKEQQKHTHTKPVNRNGFRTSERPFENSNAQTVFKNIKIQNAFMEKSNTYQQETTESFLRENDSNSSIKIEEIHLDLSETDFQNANNEIEETKASPVLYAIKEISSEVEEFDSENETRESKFICLHKATPFEFLQVWLSNNCNSNSSNGATCLLSIKPQELAKILTNKLDGTLLSSIIKAIKFLFYSGKLSESLQYLKFLLKVPRIELTALFFSTDEKDDVKNLLIAMESQLGENLDHAHKVLSIK